MIVIDRWYQHDCTIGRLVIGDFQCFTLELPNKNNEENISCIPAGEYGYFRRISPNNGEVLQLQNVPNRTLVQVHAGNYTRQIEGCILVGDSVKWLDADKIPDVTNSVNTLRRLMSLAGNAGVIKIYD